MPVSVAGIFIGGIILGISLHIFQVGPIQLIDSWYGPFVWWPGLALGLFVNRRTLHRAACFVWIPGLVWLDCGIINTSRGWHPVGISPMAKVRIELFPLKQGECGMTECLGVMFYTWPALNSVAYSIGATMALVFNRTGARSDEADAGRTKPFSG